MANILFTWELGKGSGHVTPYLNLIRQLEKQGHSVFFAMRYLDKAYRLFENTDVTTLQAPVFDVPAYQQLDPVDSYPKLLNNSGYADSYQIAGLIKGWQAIYSSVKPDIVLFDFSPTALLAARNSTFKRIIIGTGFYTPTNTIPAIGLHTLQGGQQNQKQLLEFENSLVEKIKQALKLTKLPQINCLFDIHQADSQLFSTFKELDHYPNRKEGKYIGVLHAPTGIKPPWPDHPGQKVFLYLNAFPALPQLLEILNQKKLPTLAYMVGIPENIKKKYSSDTLYIAERPLDMKYTGQTADLAICHGNHGTLLELLLSGVPVLNLPLHAEQNILSRHVEKIGAGLTAPQKTVGTIKHNLELMLDNDAYKKAARDFANRYADFDHKTACNELLKHINQLLADT